MAKHEVHVGAVIGRLTVIAEAEQKRHGQRAWICRCSCPKQTVKTVVQGNLRAGTTKSCGCAHRDSMAHTNRTRFVMYEGEKLHVSEAARRAGISRNVLLSRLKVGWPEEHLFRPADSQFRVGQRVGGQAPRYMVVYQGERMSLYQATKRAGLDCSTVQARIDGKWPEAEWFVPTDPCRKRRWAPRPNRRRAA
jgi:hypothetical protein